MTKQSQYMLLLCALTMLWASSATAQSRFFTGDDSGFGVAASMGVGESYSSVGAAVSMTAKARYDFGIAASWLTLDDKVVGNNGNATEVKPFISAALLHPNGTQGFGAEVGASYAIGTVSGDALDRLEWSKTADALNVGANVYYRLQETPSLSIYPGLSIDYINRDIGGELTSGLDTEEVAFGFSLSMLFDEKYYFAMAFRNLEEGSQWGISLGLAIPGS